MPVAESTRRLTTILASDVVGYSRLMATNEEATLAMLRTYRAVISEVVAKHGGRIFNTAGDAVLAEFGSTVEAVRCAISIQEDLAVRNAQLPDESQMWFRIGINVGDVMVEGGDLFGDGVNVAARLEGLAEKGGICISGSTFEQVKNKLSVAFADIGPQSVKNIPEPVPAFRLVPGRVSVKTGHAAVPTQSAPGSRWSARRPAIAAVAIAVVALGAAALWFAAKRSPPEHAFDGRWNVSVDQRTGCLNDDPAAYSILVTGGVIDEPSQRLPKKGTVSADGAFRIEISSPDGRPMNVQEGTIRGDVGEGRFIGAKPSCIGKVTIRRAN
jgi:class 3 adenylate cyclase